MKTIQTYKFFTLYFCGLLLLAVFANPYTTDYNLMLVMSLFWLITPVVGTVMGVVFAHRGDRGAMIVFSLMFVALVSFGRIYRNTEAAIDLPGYLEITNSEAGAYQLDQAGTTISGVLNQAFDYQVEPILSIYDPTPMIRGLVATTAIFPGVFSLIGLWCGYGATKLVERIKRPREPKNQLPSS